MCSRSTRRCSPSTSPSWAYKHTKKIADSRESAIFMRNSQFLFTLFAFMGLAESPGEEQGGGDEDDDQRGHDPNRYGVGQQGAEQHEQPDDDPQAAAEAVGGDPVFLAGQRPFRADADGVAGKAFGQVVAHGHPQQAAEQDGQRGHVDGVAQRVGVHHRADEQGHSGADP